MIRYRNLNKQILHELIHHRQIAFAGNEKLKIYGRLDCASGRRMQIQNRVFFKNEMEAIKLGFRPCGHCMREAYRQWKSQQVSG